MKLGLSIPAVQSLELLIQGNKRFVDGVKSFETSFNKTKLKELAERGQAPFCIILTCSDSRVPAETIFDRGLGDLFVIRVAGNVISSDLIASVEYAASQFGTPLCVVMGHTGCGAVQAAIDYSLTGNSSNLSEHGMGLIRKIIPSVKNAVKIAHSNEVGNLSKLTVLMNVKRNASLLLKRSTLLEKLVLERKFDVVGAIYDLHTGRVNFDLGSREKFESEFRLVLAG